MRRFSPIQLIALFFIAACGGTIDISGGTPRGDGGGPRPDGGGLPVTPGDVVVTVGKGTPFNPNENGSTGVKLDDKGGLILDPGNFGSTKTPLIWVANSAEGTVSKVETRTMKEVGRYRTGPMQSPDPSRTTVGLSGDVVVANRGGASATKIAADKAHCIDRNNNGTIDTSNGPGDVRAWGSDECVLWHTPFSAGSLARAAAYDNEIGIDGDDSSTVWIGLYATMQMKQLDSKTGAVLATVDVSPVRPYGAAVDRDGNVWVRGGGLVKIDKANKVTKYAESNCGYGLAVDSQGRPWTSGSSCVARFDPAANKWDTATVGGSNRGLAIDGKGSVWIASTGFGVYQVDVNTMQVKKSLQMGYSNFVGMAIDFDGMVWAVSQGSSTAIKIDPTTYAQSPIKVGVGPYTYSDMTGFQLRNAAAPFGKWRHTFVGCSKNTRWEQLGWEATVPVGTSVTIKGRAGADAQSLASAPWILLGKSPGDTSPLSLLNKLPAGALLEIEITLQSVSPMNTPILQSLSLAMSCITIG